MTKAFGQFPVQVCHDWNTADHVVTWARRDPLPPLPRPPALHSAPTGPPSGATAFDTLQVPVNADNWMLFADALWDARVGLAVGDVEALRRTAKLDQAVVDALVRWIRTANTAF